jgi:dipeptidyl aminopeptidase/acylaminoacyl peptidase
MKSEEYVLKGSNDKLISFDITFPEFKGKSTWILFVHGFKGFKDWGVFPLLSRKLASLGYGFLKLNFSHNGIQYPVLDDLSDEQAFAENTISKELYDLKAVINWMYSGTSIAKPDKLILAGHSRGAASSIVYAGQDSRVSALILLASVSKFGVFWNESFKEDWRKNSFIPILNSRTGQNWKLNVSYLEDLESNSEEFNLIRILNQYKNPVLLIHGNQDETVPIGQGIELTNAALFGKLISLEGQNHTFGARHPFSETDLPEGWQFIVIESDSFIKANSL